MYLNYQPQHGYNVYIDAAADDLGTQMDVGLLILEPGETYSLLEEEKECAVLLWEGTAQLHYGQQSAHISRTDCFHAEGYCLLAPRGTSIRICAETHAELYIQKTINPRAYTPVLYTPQTVQIEHKGSHGELLGTMQREIKTYFDLDNAPFSNMVLGEVLNYPGKWSSYPPHHHPQPEVYFYRFDRPQGFGAGFADGEIYRTGHNGMAVIRHGFHSQAAAPGYAMCYAWGIRHLDGNPWNKTRIDDEDHEWLWADDANEEILHVQQP